MGGSYHFSDLQQSHQCAWKRLFIWSNCHFLNQNNQSTALGLRSSLASIESGAEWSASSSLRWGSMPWGWASAFLNRLSIWLRVQKGVPQTPGRKIIIFKTVVRGGLLFDRFWLHPEVRTMPLWSFKRLPCWWVPPWQPGAQSCRLIIEERWEIFRASPLYDFVCIFFFATQDSRQKGGEDMNIFLDDAWWSVLGSFLEHEVVGELHRGVDGKLSLRWETVISHVGLEGLEMNLQKDGCSFGHPAFGLCGCEALARWPKLEKQEDPWALASGWPSLLGDSSDVSDVQWCACLKSITPPSSAKTILNTCGPLLSSLFKTGENHWRPHHRRGTSWEPAEEKGRQGRADAKKLALQSSRYNSTVLLMDYSWLWILMGKIKGLLWLLVFFDANVFLSCGTLQTCATLCWARPAPDVLKQKAGFVSQGVFFGKNWLEVPLLTWLAEEVNLGVGMLGCRVWRSWMHHGGVES